MRRYLMALIALLACLSPLSAQQPKVLAPHKPVPKVVKNFKPPREGTQRSMIGGLWMIDVNFKSSIYLRNNINAESFTVTPILYLSNGVKYVLPQVKLEPSGVAVLSVNDALRSAGIAPYATLSGYVEVQYTSFYDPICVVVNNVDAEHSLIFTSILRPLAHLIHDPDAVPQPVHFFEGVWWKEERSVSGFVALSNITNRPVLASVQVTDNESRMLGEHSTTVSPHGTKLVNLSELQSIGGTNGGLRIQYSGPEDALMVTGHLQDQSTGYSAAMPFHAPPDTKEKSKSISFSQLGLMAGAADPMMSFPAGSEFTPFSIVRNISSESISVRPNLWWMQGGRAKSAQLGWITLSPYQTIDLDFKSLLSGTGLTQFNGSVNLVLDLEGKPHSLLMAGGSVDRSKNYVFQVLPRAIEESESKEISYWSTANGNDTMVTLWNPADEAQDFLFTLSFSGGHYDVPLHLEPRVTRTFNVSEIAQNQVPDRNGNVVPASIHEGSARIAGTQDERQHILVAIEAGTYNVRKATCSYYCIYCDGYIDAFIGIAPFPVPKGGTYQLNVYAYWDTTNNETLTNLGTGNTWSSNNITIATVSLGKVTGVAVGNVTVGGTADNQDVYWQDCAYDPQCYSQTGNLGGSGNGTVNPPPHITGVLPGSGTIGSVVPVTISGSNFGSNATALSIGGIPGTVSTVDSAGTQITASFDLTSVTPGSYSFTVNLANNDGGAGVQSDNSWPFSVIPVITGISLASGTAGFVPMRSSSVSDGDNFVTYNASCNPTNGNFSWTTSSSNVTLENANGPTVVINSAKPSASLNDTVVQVTCSLNGETSNPSTLKLTVQQPTKLVKTGTDTTSAEAKCKTGSGSNGCGVDSPGRQFTYQVYDQLSPANPIKASLDFFDFIQTVQGSNGCNLTSYTTTCPANNNLSCGKLTVSGGTLPETLKICAPACLSGTSCIAQCKNGPTKANQTWTVNGFALSGDVKALAYNCSSVLVNGQ